MAGNMKIRHVLRGRCNPDRADGIVRHTYFLARAQRRLGHDVAVYGLATKSERPETIDRDGLLVHSFPRQTNPLRLHPALWSLLSTEDRDVDIFHLQVPFDPAIYALGHELARRGRPYVLSAHALWSPQLLSRHRLRKAMYTALFDRRLAHGALGIHATSASEVDDIRRYAPRTRAFAVRNSIDLDELRREARPNGFWNQVFPNLSEASRVFVFLGRLDPYQKGLDLLLQAWARVQGPGSGAAARLALIGPFWRESERYLKSAVQRQALQSRVAFVGPLFGPDKYRAMASADVYVQTSRAETSPYAIQEALACGLPVLLSWATNLAQPVLRYGAGLGVKLDVDEIARALAFFQTCPREHLVVMGANAHRLVEERHSITRAASRVVDGYVAMLRGEPFQDDD